MPAKLVKICTGCKRELPISDFYKTASLKPWPRPLCKGCHKTATTENQRKRYYGNYIQGRALCLYQQAQRRAKRKGLDFDITLDRITDAILGGVCEKTGIPFDLTDHRGSGRTGSFAPTLDRINPKRGYTIENTQIVCWLYNRAKGHGTHEEVMILVEALSYARENIKAA